MSIKQTARRGSIIFVSVLIGAILLSALGVDRIRMGGPLQQNNQMLSDLIADTLPPPVYVIEPYLEATKLLEHPETYAERAPRLKQLEGDFDTRAAFWADSDLPSDIKAMLADQTGRTGREFWDEVNRTFLPAIRRGDTAAAQASFARINIVYREHRQLIEKLVTRVQREQAEVAESGNTTLAIVSSGMVVMAASLVGLIFYSLRYLNRAAFDPLVETADITRRMAGGELEVVSTHTARSDEIGDLSRALEVFRVSAKAQVEAEARQREVVSALSRGLDELAAGNLTFRLSAPLPEEYEALRGTFNGTLDQLSAIMTGVSTSARVVSTGTAEICTASDDLALRNEQQAASIEETAAAMNQVTGMVRDNAGTAAEIQHSIAAAHAEANNGGAVVQKAIEAMAGIERSAQEINQIINVIDGIAFQTNLLALNAGVEAARAGDAGKGFAVVANEVRALAQRSADAAKDIKALITTSSQQVSGGVALVGETGKLLEKLVDQVGQINVLISGMAETSTVQATNLQQVNSSVGEMDRMTQMNAVMVEQSTAAARSLANEASDLAKLVSRFRIAGGETAKGAAISLAPRRAAMKSASATTVPAATKGAAAAQTSGNLALAAAPAEDDWSEF